MFNITKHSIKCFCHCLRNKHTFLKSFGLHLINAQGRNFSHKMEVHLGGQNYTFMLDKFAVTIIREKLFFC